MSLLKRHAWLLTLGLTTLSAIVAAFLLRAQLVELIAPPEVVDTTPSEAPGPSPSTPEAGQEPAVAEAEAPAGRMAPLDTYLAQIVDRSLFNRAGVGQWNPQPESAAPVAEEEERSTERPDEITQRSDLPFLLHSTALVDPATLSTAVLGENSAKSDVYGLGARLGADATIRGIEWRRVIVQRDSGNWEYISMDEPAAESSASSNNSEREDRSARRERRSSSRQPRTGSHVWEGVRSTGENAWEIDQAELDYALANLDRLSREARAVPSFDGGQPNGVKVFSIRRNSIFSFLGLRNNDVIRSVNGNDLSNLNDAASMYTRLLSDKNFELEVLRGGEPVRMSYSVR